MPTARPVIDIETTGPDAARRMLTLVGHGAQKRRPGHRLT